MRPLIGGHQAIGQSVPGVENSQCGNIQLGAAYLVFFERTVWLLNLVLSVRGQTAGQRLEAKLEVANPIANKIAGQNGTVKFNPRLDPHLNGPSG